MGRNNKHKRGARNKRGPVRSERRPSLTGRVQLHEHSAYVVTENGDYKVMGRGKREIMDGDTVAVSIKNSPHGERARTLELPVLDKCTRTGQIKASLWLMISFAAASPSTMGSSDSG